jgi:hypothetical protein
MCLTSNLRISDKMQFLPRQSLPMKTPPFLALRQTIRILVCLSVAAVFTGCAHTRDSAAPKQSEVLPVLRCRELIIVDEHGKNRAQIAVFPAYTAKDGQKYGESVLLRLIDQNGRPGVKIGAGADGTGVSFAGDSEKREWSGVQILANDKGSLIRLTNKDGRVQEIKP